MATGTPCLWINSWEDSTPSRSWLIGWVDSSQGLKICYKTSLVGFGGMKGGVEGHRHRPSYYRCRNMSLHPSPWYAETYPSQPPGAGQRWAKGPIDRSSDTDSIFRLYRTIQSVDVMFRFLNRPIVSVRFEFRFFNRPILFLGLKFRFLYRTIVSVRFDFRFFNRPIVFLGLKFRFLYRPIVSDRFEFRFFNRPILFLD